MGLNVLATRDIKGMDRIVKKFQTRVPLTHAEMKDFVRQNSAHLNASVCLDSRGKHAKRKLHVQVWSLPAEMVGLVLKRRMIFDVFVQENGKEKIALKMRQGCALVIVV